MGRGEGEIEVYISSFIFKELEDTLKEDFDWSKKEVKDTIERIKTKTIQVQPEVKISVIKGKDDDNRILEWAVEGEAQYIVSGDEHHILPLKEYKGVKILSPAEFLRLT